LQAIYHKNVEVTLLVFVYRSRMDNISYSSRINRAEGWKDSLKEVSSMCLRGH